MTPEEQAALDAANAQKTPANFKTISVETEQIVATRTTVGKSGKRAGKLQYIHTTKGGTEVWSDFEPSDKQNTITYKRNMSDQTGDKVFNVFAGYGKTSTSDLLNQMAALGMTNAISLD